MQTPAPAQQMSPAQQNAMARQAILNPNGPTINRIQQIGATTFYPAQNPVWNPQPVNIGLIKRFIVRCTGTISNTGSTTIALTDIGLANLFGQGGFQYTDLAGNLRVNTSGAHLSLISNAKRRGPFGATYQVNQTNPTTATQLSQMLNVAPAAWPVFTAPQTIASGTSGNFSAYFEIPLAYSDDDLRGSVYANVLSAVQQLQLTANQQPVTANPNDNTFAVYSGAAGSAGSITSMSCTVYQVYLDQLPSGNNGQPTLPMMDLSLQYQLMSTPFQNIPQNQEFQVQLTNFRKFISVFAVFNNNGTNTGRTAGTDMSYIALQAANNLYITRQDPYTLVTATRDALSTDLPLGTYYLDSRRKNLQTIQFGNLQYTFNPSTSTNASYIIAMWEMFAPLNISNTGASLASS
jgi:hypothetical protein